jgi:hypothetical protein
MKLQAHIAFGCIVAAVPFYAAAATFRAEVQGDTIVIYSSGKKPEHCSASVMFSYKYGDDRRTTRLECNGPAPAEKDYVFCKRTNAEFVDLKIERPVNGGCE